MLLSWFKESKVGRAANKSLPWIVFILLFLPIFFKPIHIDGHLMVKMAEETLVRPWLPYHADLCIRRGCCLEEGLMKYYPHPAMGIWLYQIGYLFTGDIERGARLATLAGALAAFVGCLLIMAFLGERTKYAAFLAMLSPIIYTAFPNVTMDAPAMGLLFLGAGLFLQGGESDSMKYAVWGGIIIGLSIITRYSSVVALLLPAIYFLYNRDKMNIVAATIMSALAVFFAWQFYFTIVYKLPHPLFTVLALLRYPPVAEGFSSDTFLRLGALGPALGGAILTPFIGVWLIKRMGALKLLLSIALGAFTAYIGWLLNYEAWQISFAFIMGSSGGAVLVVLFSPLISRYLGCDETVPKRELILSAWMAVTLIPSFLLLGFTTARYFIFAAPIIVYFTLKTIDSAPRLFKWFSNRALLMALMIIVTFPVAIADYIFAEDTRTALETAIEKLPTERGIVWHSQEWGARLELEKRLPKARYLCGGSQYDWLKLIILRIPVKGDLFISTYNTYDDFPPQIDYAKPIFQVKTNSRFPLRTMSLQDRAGLYGDYWGILPWNFGTSETEIVSVYRF